MLQAVKRLTETTETSTNEVSVETAESSSAVVHDTECIPEPALPCSSSTGLDQSIDSSCLVEDSQNETDLSETDITSGTEPFSFDSDVDPNHYPSDDEADRWQNKKLKV
ncbi:hypothetical protein RI129_009053 [Pyrocoelia pectoralis]|uniref:Uncharacterized protein n=1 Tax=Pyrocoelia pectoralis TaxID=417401 RepID=A0AAN7VD42_9COLE